VLTQVLDVIVHMSGENAAAGKHAYLAAARNAAALERHRASRLSLNGVGWATRSDAQVLMRRLVPLVPVLLVGLTAPLVAQRSMARTIDSVGVRPAESRSTTDDWRVTGSVPGNDRYSTLDQIDRSNVKQLQVAWTFHSGDSLRPRSEIQATPIVVGDVHHDARAVRGCASRR
jgi:hypothetical protein